MIFDKANEYLFEIFSNEEIENDFKLFHNKKKANSLGGFLENGNAYLLSKGKNKIGLKINDGDYSFIQYRKKFIACPEFQDFIENDEYTSVDNFREMFKNVDYVEFYESENNGNTLRKLSYLVNKSSYNLINYYEKFNEEEENLVYIKPKYFNSLTFYKLGLAKPANENFDIKTAPKTIACIPRAHTKIFDIKVNGQTFTHEELRYKFIEKIYSNILDADKTSYMLNDDFNYLLETAKKSIEGKSTDSDERL